MYARQILAVKIMRNPKSCSFFFLLFLPVTKRGFTSKCTELKVGFFFLFFFISQTKLACKPPVCALSSPEDSCVVAVKGFAERNRRFYSDDSQKWSHISKTRNWNGKPKFSVSHINCFIKTYRRTDIELFTKICSCLHYKRTSLGLETNRGFF